MKPLSGQVLRLFKFIGRVYPLVVAKNYEYYLGVVVALLQTNYLLSHVTAQRTLPREKGPNNWAHRIQGGLAGRMAPLAGCRRPWLQPAPADAAFVV